MFEKIKNLIGPSKKYTNPKTLSLKKMQELFFENLCSKKHHQFIGNNQTIKRAFLILSETLNANAINALGFGHNIIFVQTTGQLSCAIAPNTHTPCIIIFPDLHKLLLSGAFMNGVAVLLHEIGHIVLKHSEMNIDTLEAQVAADKFVAELGLGSELQDVLLDHQNSIDCKVRISYLTSELLDQQTEN